jgi:hypothetical protein
LTVGVAEIKCGDKERRATRTGLFNCIMADLVEYVERYD